MNDDDFISIAQRLLPNDKWSDISGEVQRTYHFPGGTCFTIKEPQLLRVKKRPAGHSHTIVCRERCYYVPVGWVGLSWEPRDLSHPVQF